MEIIIVLAVVVIVIFISKPDKLTYEYVYRLRDNPIKGSGKVSRYLLGPDGNPLEVNKNVGEYF